MSARVRQLIWLPLAALLAGCGAERAEHDAGETPAAKEVELFVKNKGVRLPPELQRDLGVATAEVMEKSVKPRLQKQAQVYRAAEGGSPAAALTWLDEAEARALEIRHKIELRSGGADAREFSGNLIRLEKSSSAAPGQVEALLEFTDSDRRCAVGSSLVATFSGVTARTALTVPEAAVIHGAGGAFVYAVNGEHFTRTPVKLGATADGWVEITDGLYAGDVVATQAADAMWLIELSALKGGSPCCPAPMKTAGK